jgi:transcription termination/antitermination protein NusG
MTSSDEFSSLPWYALKVKSRSESMAALALKTRGYDPFYPVYPERRRYSDRMKSVDTAFFPGYLFCQFDLERKLPVVSSPAVQYIVAVDGVPASIGNDLIADIRRAAEAGARPVPYLKTGQRVRVLFGPFAGLEGVFNSEAAKGQLTLSIDLLQRSVALHIDEDQVFAL